MLLVVSQLPARHWPILLLVLSLLSPRDKIWGTAIRDPFQTQRWHEHHEAIWKYQYTVLGERYCENAAQVARPFGFGRDFLTRDE